MYTKNIPNVQYTSTFTKNIPKVYWYIYQKHSQSIQVHIPKTFPRNTDTYSKNIPKVYRYIYQKHSQSLPVHIPKTFPKYTGTHSQSIPVHTVYQKHLMVPTFGRRELTFFIENVLYNISLWGEKVLITLQFWSLSKQIVSARKRKAFLF